MIRILFIAVSLALLGSSCSSVKKSTRRLRAQHEAEIKARIDSSGSSQVDSGKIVRTDSGSVKTETKTDENKIVVTLDPAGADSGGGEIVYYPAPIDPVDYLSPDPKPVKIKVPKNARTVEIHGRREETKKDSVSASRTDSISVIKTDQATVKKDSSRTESSSEEMSSKNVKRTAILTGVGSLFLLALFVIWYVKRKREKKSLL